MSDEIKDSENKPVEAIAEEKTAEQTEAKPEVIAEAKPEATSDTESPKEAPAAESEEAKPKKVEKPKAAKKGAGKPGDTSKLYTGRRKTSISRVKLMKGEGKITVNKKPIDQFFSKGSDVNKVLQPLKLLGIDKEFDILATVKGGGTTGQAEAIRMGLSRSLKEINEEYHKKLRTAGYLTRDSRMVERKKYGLHKARRASQFSKR